MKHIIAILFLFLLGSSIKAQEQTDTTEASVGQLPTQFPKNAVYMELGGASGVYSINYERSLGKNFWLRIGAGYFLKIRSFPLSVNYLMGGDKSYFELGLGATRFYRDLSFIKTWLGDIEDDEELPDSFKVNTVFLIGNVGYRYQPLNKKIFLRVTLGPAYFFDSGKIEGVRAGLSFGGSF